MKTFVAVFTGSPEATEASGWNALPEAERRAREVEGVKAWGAWMQANAAAVVDGGGPLGKTKRVDRHGVSDIRNAMAAYIVIRAVSHEAAAALFLDHPHFSIFPGDGVEIMERLPVPGQ